MIVSVSHPDIDEYHENVAAVVRDADGTVRLCRDGLPDQYLDDDVVLVVTP